MVINHLQTGMILQVYLEPVNFLYFVACNVSKPDPRSNPKRGQLGSWYTYIYIYIQYTLRHLLKYDLGVAPPSNSGKERLIGISKPKSVTILVVTVTGRGPHPKYDTYFFKLIVDIVDIIVKCRHVTSIYIYIYLCVCMHISLSLYIYIPLRTVAK